MKVLVIGSGGREHALAWKIAQSPRVSRVFVAPGNAGTAIEAENVPIGSEDIPALVKFVKDNGVELTVVGRSSMKNEGPRIHPGPLVLHPPIDPDGQAVPWPWSCWPPITWTCRWPTVWPPSWPVLITTR